MAFRRRRSSPQPEPVEDADKGSGGALQAMDHVANWVRFADTKATILTAGLGVVITMLMANAETITTGITEGCTEAVVVGLLAGGAAISAAWTLGWLIRAIAPASTITYKGLNRLGAALLE